MITIENDVMTWGERFLDKKTENKGKNTPKFLYKKKLFLGPTIIKVISWEIYDQHLLRRLHGT